MFHDGYPGHKLGPTLMYNPSPSTPSFLLHTHTPCPHKHCNHTTFLQDATFIPTQNGPFHSRREPVELRNIARCLFFHFLHSHSLSLSLPLCVFTDTDHEALEFNLLFIFLVRELNHPVLPASTCFNLVLKAAATFTAECQRVRSQLERTMYLCCFRLFGALLSNCYARIYLCLHLFSYVFWGYPELFFKGLTM